MNLLDEKTKEWNYTSRLIRKDLFWVLKAIAVIGALVFLKYLGE